MSLSYKDQTLWSVYITIGNLDAKTRYSQIRLGILLLGSIPIVYKRLKDGNNKNKDLKAMIYYLALKTMLQRKCPLSMYRWLGTYNILDIALQETYKEHIKIRCTNSFERHCYPIFLALMVNYKEEVLITGIKANMQCLIFYVLPKKREIVTKSWDLHTHELIWEHFECQVNNPTLQRNKTTNSWLHP